MTKIETVLANHTWSWINTILPIGDISYLLSLLIRSKNRYMKEVRKMDKTVKIDSHNENRFRSDKEEKMIRLREESLNNNYEVKTKVFKSDITDKLLKRVQKFEKHLINGGLTYDYYYDEEERCATFSITDERAGEPMGFSVFLSNLKQIDIYCSYDYFIPKEDEMLLIKMLSPTTEGAGFKLFVPSVEYFPDDSDCELVNDSEVIDLNGEYKLSLGYTYIVPDDMDGDCLSKYLTDELLFDLREEAMSVKSFFGDKRWK